MNKSVDVNNGVRLDEFFNVMLEEVATDPRVLNKPRDRLVQRARKKARYVDPGLSAKAVLDFLADNSRMREFTVQLDQDIVNNASHYITVMLERFTTGNDVSMIQETLDLGFLYDNWRFGPGSSFEVKGTHAADKITEKMTCTTSCEPFVTTLRRINPYFSSFDAANEDSGIARVNGSKLTTVPKNQDTERTIAIEPSGNMAMQLAAGHYLEGTLRYLGLDIRRQQPLNQALARRGSIDGSIATLDLKSASNMMSPELVRLLFPKKWYELMMAIRSSEIRLPDGKWERLEMMSTMGNGFTFPLMTLTIVALIYAYRCRKPTNPTLFVDWRSTAVFGDDIIIPVDEYDECVTILEQAGFVINNDKSYREGSFRESCGGDYDDGVDVSPFYCKSLLTDSEVYIAINQVLDWSVRNNCFLPSTLRLLRSMLTGKLHLVPEWHNPDQGVLTKVCNRRYSYLSLVSSKVSLDEKSWFAYPLACAGYISTAELSRSYTTEPGDEGSKLEPSDPDMIYLPRSFEKPRYKVRHARLPKGYTSGWDANYRNHMDSSLVELYVHLTMGA